MSAEPSRSPRLAAAAAVAGFVLLAAAGAPVLAQEDTVARPEAGVVGAAAAPEPAQTTVELNRLEDAGGGCRLTLVVANPGQERFQSLKLDLVIFDGDGVVARRLAVEAGPVRSHKTVVRLFEAADLACGGIGRLLLNDVVACEGEAGALAGCVDRLATASRTAVPFER